MHNLLFLTGELNYTDGVSSHLYNLISELQKNKNYNITLLCTGGDSAGRFKDLKIKILEDNTFGHNNRSVKNFSVALKRLIKFIYKNKIDILHSHNHYAANISYYASRFTGVITVQTNHGIIPQGGFLKHFKAHKYITVSETIEKYLLKYKPETQKNARFINQGFQYAGNIRKSSDGEIRIICASRLIREKGIDVFIRAAKIVTGRYNGKLRFFIAGEGEYEGVLKSLAKSIHVSIVFLGTIKNLPELLSETNIFVMPTRIPSEGFPMTLVEAAMTKNLIISSDFNSLKNFFKNEVDGFTFEIDNHEQLAEKMLKALNNPDQARLMTETFFKKSKILFDPSVMCNKHIEVYKECLKE
ncbi:MAG: glycosyltransferase family 4 protein [bacterium]